MNYSLASDLCLCVYNAKLCVGTLLMWLLDIASFSIPDSNIYSFERMDSHPFQ